MTAIPRACSASVPVTSLSFQELMWHSSRSTERSALSKESLSKGSDLLMFHTLGTGWCERGLRSQGVRCSRRPTQWPTPTCGTCRSGRLPHQWRCSCLGCMLRLCSMLGSSARTCPHLSAARFVLAPQPCAHACGRPSIFWSLVALCGCAGPFRICVPGCFGF